MDPDLIVVNDAAIDYLGIGSRAHKPVEEGGRDRTVHRMRRRDDGKGHRSGWPYLGSPVLKFMTRRYG